MDQGEFAEFLKSNSIEGTIQVVAGKVSDLLRTAFGCKYIIFLRKQRGLLELNYFHGIRAFNRRDFRLRFSQELADFLREDFQPRPVGVLEKHLPGAFRENLNRYGLDLFFPIFWRENLYGVYFVRSNIETGTAVFQMLLAAVAQSLSAAYHVKWHESKLNRLQQRLGKTIPTGGRTGQYQVPARLLRLLQHRNSQTIIRELFDILRSELGLSRAVFLYEGKHKSEPLRLLRSDNISELESPDRDMFDHVLAKLSQQGHSNVFRLEEKQEAPASWTEQFRKAGLKHVVAFPLSPNRAGLFVWGDGKAPAEVLDRLRLFRDPAAELISNAESFEKAEEMSYTDGLTGLANHRYFTRRIEEEIDRARRYNRSLALIILDMDDLKGINDRFGHQAGDAVIKRMGHILRSSIRAIDIIARYGGDEFCAIMPEADATTCERFMSRLQTKIAGSRFNTGIAGTDLECTVSLGGAVFPDHGLEPEQLVFSADMALLKAKEAGRNSFRLYASVS